jgi:hypothetical protein
MGLIVGFDPGFARREKGDGANPCTLATGHPRAREGRDAIAAAVGDGRAPGLRPAELRASRSGEGCRPQHRASPRQPARAPQFGSAGVPFPGPWEDPFPRKRSIRGGTEPRSPTGTISRRARAPPPPARLQPLADARFQRAGGMPCPRPDAPLRNPRFMIILSHMPTARAIYALLLSLTG